MGGTFSALVLSTRVVSFLPGWIYFLPGWFFYPGNAWVKVTTHISTRVETLSSGILHMGNVLILVNVVGNK